jgi:hypothetical protein
MAILAVLGDFGRIFTIRSGHLGTSFGHLGKFSGKNDEQVAAFEESLGKVHEEILASARERKAAGNALNSRI